MDRDRPFADLSATAETGPDQSQERAGFPHRQARSNHLTHCLQLLRSALVEAGLQVEVVSEPWYFHMGCWCSQWQLACCSTVLAPVLKMYSKREVNLWTSRGSPWNPAI